MKAGFSLYMTKRKTKHEAAAQTFGGRSAPHPPTEEEVREEIDRILDSPIFSQSDRLARFLRFTADHALSGKANVLKEYLIGVSVYDRRPPYHPSQDSIVRTEARRLRAKLKEYYETIGKESAVFIYYRPGNYTPLFRRGGTVSENGSGDLQGTNELLSSGVGVGLAVIPFVDLSSNPLSAQCAHGLTDELTHALTHTDGLRVVSHAALAHFTSSAWDMGSLLAKLNVVSAVEGAVRIDDGRLRVTIRVVNADGFQSSSHRFETLADPRIIAEVQQQIVTAFISRGRPLQSRIRKRLAGAGALTLAVYPLVIHAETMLNEGSAADIHPAMLKFQEAIEMAPAFARSYCGLAQCHIDLALRGAPHSKDIAAQAIQSAKKAVQLDPEMFGCHSTLATAYALEWQWKEADECYAIAKQLGIHAPSSRQYALYLALAGRYDEGTEQLAISQRIDPFSYRHKVAVAKFLHITGRFDELLESPMHQRRYGDVPLECKILTALAAAHVGDRRRALALIADIQSEYQPHSLIFTSIAEAMALAGERGRAEKIIQDYDLLSPESPVSIFRKALLALSIGRESDCLSLLQTATEHREAEFIWLERDPRFASIQKSKEFITIVSRVFAQRHPQC